MVNEAFVFVNVLLIISMLSVVLVFAWRYKKVPPDQAMVVYGRLMSSQAEVGYRVLTGGGKYILPIIEDVQYMDLGLKEIVLDLDNVPTDPLEGSKHVRIKLVALYKISSERNAIYLASEHLLGKTAEDIKKMVKVVIEGTLRGDVCRLTPRNLDLHREEVADSIRKMASGDLLNLGIEIRALAIIRVHIKGVT
jgi:flotillin